MIASKICKGRLVTKNTDVMQNVTTQKQTCCHQYHICKILIAIGTKLLLQRAVLHFMLRRIL